MFFYPHQISSGTCRDPTAQIWSGSDLDQILSKNPAEISPCSEQFTSKKNGRKNTLKCARNMLRASGNLCWNCAQDFIFTQCYVCKTILTWHCMLELVFSQRRDYCQENCWKYAPGKRKAMLKFCSRHRIRVNSLRFVCRKSCLGIIVAFSPRNMLPASRNLCCFCARFLSTEGLLSGKLLKICSGQAQINAEVLLDIEYR